MIRNHLDFSAHVSTWITLAVIPVSAFIIMYAPDSWGYENGILENTQMILLMLSLIFCVTSTPHRSLFIFIATLILFMMLREVNCGRVLLWSRSGDIFHCGPVQDYLKWKEIPGGSVIRTSVYAVATCLCLAAFLRKGNLKSMAEVVLRTKIPAWEALLLITGVATGMIAEKANICFIAEEMGEILMYTALTAAIYRYTRGKQPCIAP